MLLGHAEQSQTSINPVSPPQNQPSVDLGQNCMANVIGVPVHMPHPIQPSLAGLLPLWPSEDCLAPRGFQTTTSALILFLEKHFLSAYHIPGPGLRLAILWRTGHCPHRVNRPCRESNQILNSHLTKTMTEGRGRASLGVWESEAGKLSKS